MNTDEFRELALGLDGAVEGGHFGKADFRVRGRIFATLAESDGIGTLKLTPDDQAVVLAVAGAAAVPAAGAWGRSGWTQFDLAGCASGAMAAWMQTAWATVAPRKR